MGGEKKRTLRGGQGQEKCADEVSRIDGLKSTSGSENFQEKRREVVLFSRGMKIQEEKKEGGRGRRAACNLCEGKTNWNEGQTVVSRTTSWGEWEEGGNLERVRVHSHGKRRRSLQKTELARRGREGRTFQPKRRQKIDIQRVICKVRATRG